MADTVNQATSMPTRKVAFGSLASLIAFVIMLAVKLYAFPDMDSQLAYGLMILLTAIAGPITSYLVPEWKLPTDADMGDVTLDAKS